MKKTARLRHPKIPAVSCLKEWTVSCQEEWEDKCPDVEKVAAERSPVNHPMRPSPKVDSRRICRMQEPLRMVKLRAPQEAEAAVGLVAEAALWVVIPQEAAWVVVVPQEVALAAVIPQEVDLPAVVSREAALWAMISQAVVFPAAVFPVVFQAPVWAAQCLPQKLVLRITM